MYEAEVRMVEDMVRYPTEIHFQDEKEGGQEHAVRGTISDHPRDGYPPKPYPAYRDLGVMGKLRMWGEWSMRCRKGAISSTRCTRQSVNLPPTISWWCKASRRHMGKVLAEFAVHLGSFLLPASKLSYEMVERKNMNMD